MNYRSKYLKYKAKYLGLKETQVGGKNNFTRKINDLLNNINSNYGIIISKNNKIVYEKYIGNKKDTKFRVFSCTKPILALSIIMLIQEKKLKLNDTIDKFCINIPYNNKITIGHLLNHASGVYDFSKQLYSKLNPKYLFDSILNNEETGFIDFETMITEINKNKPYFVPKKNYNVNLENYNDTGYDILGYIVYIVSGIKTDIFIRNKIFKPLKMRNSGFQHDRDINESIPYEDEYKKGIKEQQNWFCCNGNIVCTLRDYIKFLDGYEKLLKKKYLQEFKKIYFFGITERNNKKCEYLWHSGHGDFSYNHGINKEEYNALSLSLMTKFFNEDTNINIVISENYQNTEGFFNDNYKNWNILLDNIIEPEL